MHAGTPTSLTPDPNPISPIQEPTPPTTPPPSFTHPCLPAPLPPPTPLLHPGKGRGLVAQVDIQPAETVLVLEPVGLVLRAPAGRELRPDHLLNALAQGPMVPADR